MNRYNYKESGSFEVIESTLFIKDSINQDEN